MFISSKYATSALQHIMTIISLIDNRWLGTINNLLTIYIIIIISLSSFLLVILFPSIKFGGWTPVHRFKETKDITIDITSPRLGAFHIVSCRPKSLQKFFGVPISSPRPWIDPASEISLEYDDKPNVRPSVQLVNITPISRTGLWYL